MAPTPRQDPQCVGVGSGSPRRSSSEDSAAAAAGRSAAANAIMTRGDAATRGVLRPGPAYLPFPWRWSGEDKADRGRSCLPPCANRVRSSDFDRTTTRFPCRGPWTPSDRALSTTNSFGIPGTESQQSLACLTSTPRYPRSPRYPRNTAGLGPTTLAVRVWSARIRMSGRTKPTTRETGTNSASARIRLTHKPQPQNPQPDQAALPHQLVSVRHESGPCFAREPSPDRSGDPAGWALSRLGHTASPRRENHTSRRRPTTCRYRRIG